MSNNTYMVYISTMLISLVAAMCAGWFTNRDHYTVKWFVAVFVFAACSAILRATFTF